MEQLLPQVDDCRREVASALPAWKASGGGDDVGFPGSSTFDELRWLLQVARRRLDDIF